MAAISAIWMAISWSPIASAVSAMFGYVTLGTNDLARAAKFYDELLSLVGAVQIKTDEKMCMWNAGGTEVLGVCLPFDGKPATAGNGTMLGLKADSQQQVDQLYAKALELGGQDEGPPGPRGEGGPYSAYFRDLDGNKLVAYYFG